jgi:hypothetical protein
VPRARTASGTSSRSARQVWVDTVTAMISEFWTEAPDSSRSFVRSYRPPLAP